MPYQIENIDITKWRDDPHPTKWWQIIELEVGQGFRVPFTDLPYNSSDPTHVVRTSAWLYGKKLGRKFATRTLPNRSVLVVRLA